MSSVNVTNQTRPSSGLVLKTGPPLEDARPSSTVSLLKRTMKVETLSPSFAMFTETLEHSTMGRQSIRDVLAEYISVEIIVLIKDLAFRDLIIKDQILGTAQRRSLLEDHIMKRV